MRIREWEVFMQKSTRMRWSFWQMYPAEMQEVRSMPLSLVFWRQSAVRTARFILRWMWRQNVFKSGLCAMIRAETIIMIRFPHLSKVCGDLIPMLQCIIWQKCCMQEKISNLLPAGSWSVQQRMWEMQILWHSRWLSPQHRQWSGSGCRRHRLFYRRQYCMWRLRQKVIRRSMRFLRQMKMYGNIRPRFRHICRMHITRVLKIWDMGSDINMHMTIRIIM